MACCKVRNIHLLVTEIVDNIKYHSSKRMDVRTDLNGITFQICKDPPSPEVEVLADSQTHWLKNRNNMGDQPQVRTDQDVLNEGGCKWRGKVYENSALWHPSVLPYGEINCVSCKCKVKFQNATLNLCNV